MTVLIDPDLKDDELRQAMYDGKLIVLTRLQAVRDLVDYTRDQLVELFGGYDPEHVHEHIDPAEMAELLGAWQLRFRGTGTPGTARHSSSSTGGCRSTRSARTTRWRST